MIETYETSFPNQFQGSQRPMVQNQENRQDTSGEKIRNFRKNQDNRLILILQFSTNSLINEWSMADLVEVYAVNTCYQSLSKENKLSSNFFSLGHTFAVPWYSFILSFYSVSSPLSLYIWKQYRLHIVAKKYVYSHNYVKCR